MPAREFNGMMKSSSFHHFCEGVHRVTVKVRNTLSLLFNVNDSIAKAPLKTLPQPAGNGSFENTGENTHFIYGLCYDSVLTGTHPANKFRRS